MKGKFLNKLSVVVLFGALFGALSCEKTPPPDPPATGDLLGITFAPKPYTIKKPNYFPPVPVPDSNQMTVDGVELGRRLFYDPILSGDSTQSCASCHFPGASFTDNRSVSLGIQGFGGTRSSMSLLNIAYATNGLFWDGRVRTLEQQALLPVEDPIEMHHSWQKAIPQLRRHKDYPALFRKAFGINDRKEIDKFLAAKAIAQFERILISSGKSKYDRFLAGDKDALDDDELDGKLMFFDEGPSVGLALPDAECFHCHGGLTLTGNNYFNNGLDNVSALTEFKDKGRGAVTGNVWDNGKFRAPTLRNIAMTAPYMHDGRFKTLEEVVDHYIRGGFNSPNEDPFIRPLGIGSPSNPNRFSPAHRRALLKFLNALTDREFMDNPDIQNPFK